jgi:hypothetical protein
MSRKRLTRALDTLAHGLLWAYHAHHHGPLDPGSVAYALILLVLSHELVEVWRAH